MGAWIDIEVKENSQNIVNNTSNIDVRVICYWDGWSYNHNEIISGVPSASGYLQIDGVTYDFRNYFNYYRTQSGSEDLFTKNVTVNHDDNGKRTVKCYALYRTGVSSGDQAASKTVDLTDIPRFASITAAPNFHDEENPRIQYANYAGNVVSSLQACISLDGEKPFATDTTTFDYEEVLKDGNEHTFQLSDSQRETLRKATPNSNTLDVYFLLRTVIGGNTGISSAVAVMSIKDPKPVLSPIVKDTNAKTIAVTGNEDILVAGYSVASVAVNATARKHATIISRRVENGQQVLDGDGTLSPVINAPIRIMATDSRGNTGEVEAGNTIVPYFAPNCHIENTMPDGEGTMHLPINGAWFNGSIGKTVNSLTVQYQYRENYGDYGDWITIPTVTVSDNNFAAQTTLKGLNYKSSYTFKARVIDAVVTDGITSAEKTVKAEPVFDWGQDDFKFNVPVTAPSLDADCVKVINAPSGETDAANKKYVDGAVKAVEDRLQELDRKISITILWENASPTSSYGEHLESIDWVGYDRIGIQTDCGYSEMVAKNSAWTQIGHSMAAEDANNSLMYGNRLFTLVNFEDIGMKGVGIGKHMFRTQYGEVQNDAYCIPLVIYGIKGVIK